jgi:two-component system nitrate/nitrite response regulator NarL
MNQQIQQKLTGNIQEILSFNSEVLLQYLVASLSIAKDDPAVENLEIPMDEIIFVSKIDGVRYYLIRSRAKFEPAIKLSPREMAIAHLIAQGLSNKDIGKNLNISYWTVNTYLRRIFIKLGVTSRTAMVTRLMEEHREQFFFGGDGKHNAVRSPN